MSFGDSSNASLPTSTLDRLSLVLDSFRSASRLSLTEVSRGTGIPRTSTLRMLEQLVRMGWLRRRGAEYELGDTLAELGALSLYRDSVDRVVTPLLRELHLVTGHVVHLGILDGKDVLYLEKVGGSAAPHLQTRVGTRVPARSSTIGKALLTSAPRPGVPLVELQPVHRPADRQADLRAAQRADTRSDATEPGDTGTERHAWPWC